MTIGELKKEMLEIPEEYDNLEIYQAIDEEGNGYFPFSGIGYPYYMDKSDDHDRPDSMRSEDDLNYDLDLEEGETFEEYVEKYFIKVAVA